LSENNPVIAVFLFSVILVIHQWFRHEMTMTSPS